MMRIVLSALAVMEALAFAAPAHAADGDGITPAIAQCLRDNAARVEAAEPDLTKATDYLVSNACAQPVADEQTRLNTLRIKTMAERTRDRCEARRKFDADSRPASTRPTYDNCAEQYDTVIGVRTIYPTGLGIGPRPPAVVSMAAKLILDLRVAHNKARP
jgi:hypothetical protein